MFIQIFSVLGIIIILVHSLVFFIFPKTYLETRKEEIHNKANEISSNMNGKEIKMCIRDRIQAIQKQFDTPLPVLGGPATTDAAEFIKSQKQFDIVVFGPGVTTVPHQINEYVEISNYFEQIDIYKKIITTYLSDE